MLGFLFRVLVAGLVLVVLLAAALIVGTYTFLPPMIEESVARDVQRELGLRTAPEVDLRSDPPPSMLAGGFSGGEISLGGADLGGVRAERLAVDLDPFDLDVLASVREGAPESEGPLSGALEAEISEAEVARLVEENAAAPVSGVRLVPGAAVVESEVSVLGTSVPASARGPVLLRGGDLVFEPREVEAFGVPVPQDVAQQFLAGTDFSYALRDLPYGAEVSDVAVEDGRLLLRGRAERIPLG